MSNGNRAARKYLAAHVLKNICFLRRLNMKFDNKRFVTKGVNEN